MEDYVINVYLLLGQGHTVTIYTKFSQMSHICILLVVHDIFYLPILLGCMIPINICVIYTVPLLCKVKKNPPYNWKPIKRRLVQEIIYLAVTIYQLLRYGWILCFCILFRYKLLNLNCSHFINHVTCVTIFLLEINIVQKRCTAKKASLKKRKWFKEKKYYIT